MTTKTAIKAAPTYPITKPSEGDGDPRFTLGLALDVAAVLARHGFPPIETGADIVRLEMALYRAIYGGEL